MQIVGSMDQGNLLATSTACLDVVPDLYVEVEELGDGCSCTVLVCLLTDPDSLQGKRADKQGEVTDTTVKDKHPAEGRGHSPRVKLRRRNQPCSPLTFPAALGTIPCSLLTFPAALGMIPPSTARHLHPAISAFISQLKEDLLYRPLPFLLPHVSSMI
jgi:hypothetical protein